MKLVCFFLAICLLSAVTLATLDSLQNGAIKSLAYASAGIVFDLIFWKWMPLGIHEEFTPTPTHQRPKLALIIVPSLIISAGLIVISLSNSEFFEIFLGTVFLTHSILWIASVLRDEELI